MDSKPVTTASCDFKSSDNGSEKLLEENRMEEGNQLSDEAVFVGGGQFQVNNLQKLAIDTLDMSWPNWRNYEDPECCIIPPIFSYTNPDKSDQDCQDKKVKLRHSEWAEHIVYRAIYAAVQKKLPAPILAVHSLDLDRIRHHLPHIFPDVKIKPKDPFLREYDFVLIGPKIGLVVIEVKSSEFSGPSDFKSNKHLPKDYSDGIKQLQYFGENFLNYLQKCTGIKWPEESPVRRVLFMPNLERARHEEWRQNHGERYQNADPSKAGSFDYSDEQTIKWYKEDLDNGQEDRNDPELLTTMSKLLEGDPKYKISGEIYEAYASIIAALGSVIVFKNQPNTKLDPLKLIEREALMREANNIEAQDPAGQLLKNRKMKVESLKHFSKVILPTPDQLKALKGPNRQFIIGSAGTGKTIVLQEKALQLLRKGLKVLILAPECYVSRYKELFDSNSLHGYEVRESETIRDKFKDTAKTIFLEIYDYGLDPFETIYNRLKRGKDENSEEWRQLDTHFDLWMADFDVILMDDAIDRVGDFYDWDRDDDRTTQVMDYVTIIAYSELKYPEKIVWIALDLTMRNYDFEHIHLHFKWIFTRVIEQLCGQKCCVLDRVMRSSENIFLDVYKDIEVLSKLFGRPSIGHKVVGPEVTRISDSYVGYPAEMLWERIKLELDRLLDQKIPLSCISIVLGGSFVDTVDVLKILIEQLRDCGIPFKTPRNEDLGENDQQVSKSNGIQEALSIYCWDDVSSLEWPIVIYVYAVLAYQDWSDKTDIAMRMFQRYRACSRATTKLIEIVTEHCPVDPNRKCEPQNSDSEEANP